MTLYYKSYTKLHKGLPPPYIPQKSVTWTVSFLGKILQFAQSSNFTFIYKEKVLIAAWSSEPWTEVGEQTQLVAAHISLLFFVFEAAAEEVEQNLVEVFVDVTEVVSNTGEYLHREICTLTHLEDLCKTLNVEDISHHNFLHHPLLAHSLTIEWRFSV